MTDGELPRSLQPPTTATDAEIAAYVAEACRDLRGLSRTVRFRTLNYMLDAARIEAERIARAVAEEGRSSPI